MSVAFTAALKLVSGHEDLLLLARATNNLRMIGDFVGQHEGALGHRRPAVAIFGRPGATTEVAALRERFPSIPGER